MRYKVSPDVVTTMDHGECVLLNMKNGNFYGLDEIGAEIWEMLQQGQTFEQIILVIHQEYGVSQEQLQQDIGGLLNSLTVNGLVSQVG